MRPRIVKCCECGTRLVDAREQNVPQSTLNRLGVKQAAGWGGKDARLQWCPACYNTANIACDGMPGNRERVYQDDPSPWEQNAVRALEDCRDN